jgi:transposase-like protein
MASVLKEPYFQDEAAAFERLEAIVWPNGPVCPHCGCTGRIRPLSGVKDKKGRVRLGLRKCYDCRGQFTVRKGTVFEDSPIPLHFWFQAAYFMCSSKKGVSSNQTPHARRHTANRMVYEPSASRGHAHGMPNANGRRWWRC